MNINDKALLKRTHSYYSQIQAQLAVTARPWCDFLVFTQHGYLLERIQYDQSTWSRLEGQVTYFVKHHLLPYIMKKS